jgi:hypothetical protein
MKLLVHLLYIILFVFGTTKTNAQQVTYKTADKKIVDLYSNPPAVVEAFEMLSKKPKTSIDGYVIKLPEYVGEGYIFHVEQWKKIAPQQFADFAKSIKNLPEIKHAKENFLMLYAGCTMDWFNDDDWKLVEENIIYSVSVAKKIGMKGICWDPESYKGHNPWEYAKQPDYKKHTFLEYCAQVRKRGARFMQLIQQYFPGGIILSLRELSDYASGSAYTNKLLSQKDSLVNIYMEEQFFALRPAFINGNLDALQPGTRWIDGNEDAYYYTSALEFYQNVNTLRHDANMLVDSVNRLKYLSQVEVGNAISSDYIGAKWAKLKDYSFPAYLCSQAYFLTPAQRAIWFEHNTYYSLKTANEYVWLYDEETNWLRNQKIPEGFEKALISAKNKILNKEALGFAVEKMLLEAQKKAKEKIKLNKVIKK